MFANGTHAQMKSSIEAIGASFGIFEFNPDNNSFKLISANSMYEEVLSTAILDSIGKEVKQIFPRYIEKPLKNILHECRNTQLAKEEEIIMEHKQTTRWWRFVFSPIIDEDFKCNRIINTCIEITDKKLLEKELQLTSNRYEAVVEAAYDGIITIDESRNISMMNESAKYIFGLEDDDVIGQPLTNLMPQKYRSKHNDYVHSFSQSEISSRPMQSRASVRGLRKDGTEFPIEVTISKIKVGQKIEMTAVVRDISERAKLVEELSKAAKQDPLTGIYNRRYFSEALTHEIERSDRFDRDITLVIFDLDHFKNVNDTYGHECGDLVLKEVVNIVQNETRTIDIFARWGGEEFIVLLTETSIEDAYNWAERVRNLIADSRIDYDGNEVSVTCSFGVTSKSAHGLSGDALIKDADERLYQAKESGRNRTVK